MIKTFTATEQNPALAADKATDTANLWLKETNHQREVNARVPYVIRDFTTTMTLAPAIETSDPDWFVFTITVTLGI